MATNQPPSRPWFRLPSIARPAAPTRPTAEPPAPQPRPPLALPVFRPLGQTQPQEPTAAVAPPTTGLSSVPASPISRASVPSSPVTKTTQTTTPSVPSSPVKPKDSAAFPTSPEKPAPSSTLQISRPSPPKPSSTSSLPTSPVGQLSTSPVKRVPTITSTFTNGTTTTSRLPTPTPSPRTIMPAVQTPPLSPKHKPTAPPPSPLILPPPQLKSKPELEHKIPVEAEPKGVLIQKTIETPKPNGSGSLKDLHKSYKPDIAYRHHGKHEERKDTEAKKKGGQHKKFSSDSEGGMKVITIAGENKGAFMEIIKSPAKHGFDGKPQTLGRADPTTEKGKSEWHKYITTTSSSSEEENSKKKDKSHKGKGIHSPPMDAYLNSNVQGVNNSILFKSSCSHHDPGVRLSLSRKPLAKESHVKDKESRNGHHS